MFIVNQDRDQIIQKTYPLFTIPMIRTSAFSGNKYILAINLYHGTDLLGSYDNDNDARNEMDRINNCRNKIHFVGGFHGSSISVMHRLNALLRRLNENQ